MLSKEFEFHAPRDLDHAVELLGASENAKLLAGGMSLMPAMNLGLARPDAIVSLSRVEGLDYVEETERTLRIGAMVRHDRIERDPLIRRYCPLLTEAASVIGDVQIRHRGTIGGSLAHADPAADYLPVVVAVGATMTIAGGEGERRVGAREFFVDIMRTEVSPSEILREIELPKLNGGGSAYRRLARLEGSFPIVNGAAVVVGGTASVAVGGATSTPALLQLPVELAEALDQVEEAASEACADAFGDLSGSGDYRRAMARVYARRALEAAAAVGN